MRGTSIFQDKNYFLNSKKILRECFFYYSFEAGYSAYCKDAKVNLFPQRSSSFLRILQQKLKIHMMSFDKYLCLYCSGAKKENPNVNHQELVRKQSTYFRKTLDSLQPRQCLIVQDYTRFHETTQKFHDLCLTVFQCNKDGVLEHSFFDFFCEAPHNYMYTCSVWDLFVSETLKPAKFSDGLFLWSDNAFKTKELLFYFSELEDRIGVSISLNFFAPHHGHSICDGHFGTGKRHLRANSKGVLVSGLNTIVDCFATLKQTKVQILSELKYPELRVIKRNKGLGRVVSVQNS
jgi:hypothetical protein